MEEKKKFFDPVAWSKHCLVLALIAAGIYFLSWFAELTFILLMTCMIIALISLVRLIIIKEKTKKPYIQAMSSIIISIALFGLIVIGYKHSGQIAMEIICRAKINQLSECILETSKANNNKYQNSNWCDLIKDEIDFEDTYRCLRDKTGPCSYAMNENIPADANELPGDLVLLFESAPGWNQTGGADDVVIDRHYKNRLGGNIAFADGHVEFVEAEDIPNLRWTLEEQ